VTAGREPITCTKDWCTPSDYVDAVKRVFGGTIHLDPCSNEHSIVQAEVEIALPTDGLAVSWNYPTIYVNPPYGRIEGGTTIRDWLRKCSEARDRGSELLALVPVATNTRHWRDHVFTATGICFLKVPRLKFMLNGHIVKKGAPMACAVVYWGSSFEKFRQVFRDFGAVLRCNKVQVILQPEMHQVLRRGRTAK